LQNPFSQNCTTSNAWNIFRLKGRYMTLPVSIFDNATFLRLARQGDAAAATPGVSMPRKDFTLMGSDQPSAGSPSGTPALNDGMLGALLRLNDFGATNGMMPATAPDNGPRDPYGV
jgi:hypothetical protein